MDVEFAFKALVKEIDENLRLTLRSQQELCIAACSPFEPSIRSPSNSNSGCSPAQEPELFANRDLNANQRSQLLNPEVMYRRKAASTGKASCTDLHGHTICTTCLQVIIPAELPELEESELCLIY